jgi:hypothetical protein
MENLKELLEEFIDWARDCGEEVWYVLTIRKKLLRNFSDNERNSLLITLSVWCRLRHENALYILLCVVRIN